MSLKQEEIVALVRQVVNRTMRPTFGSPILGAPSPARSILGEEEIRRMQPGSTHTIAPDTLVTPLGQQVAMELGIRLEGPTSGHTSASPVSPVEGNSSGRLVALGADHGGYALKDRLKKVVAAEGFGVIDCGTDGPDAVDYPDFAYAVAALVASERAWRGIIVDGAGIGSCMAANKVPGVRAAMCYDQATAVNSREHNNANVLTLGAGLIGPSLADQIVRSWLATQFGGGRHARRVNKIDAIGDRFLKK